MKKLIVMLALLVFNSSAYALCYPLEDNHQGLTDLCITQIDGVSVSMDLYKGDSLVHSVSGQKKYLPRRIVCSGKEHDCREAAPVLIAKSENAYTNGNGIKINIHFWITEPEKCMMGSIELIDRPYSYQQVKLKCSKQWWDI